MAQLNEEMTVEEFMRWQAYYLLYPFGNEDLSTARLLHQQATIWSKKGHAPDLERFLLGDPPAPQMTPEEMEAALKLRFEKVSDD